MKVCAGQATRRGRPLIVSGLAVAALVYLGAGTAIGQETAAVPNGAAAKLAAPGSPPGPASAPKAVAKPPVQKPAPTAAAKPAPAPNASRPAQGQAQVQNRAATPTQPRASTANPQQRNASVRPAARAPAAPEEDPSLRSIAVNPGTGVAPTLQQAGLAANEIEGIVGIAGNHLNKAELSQISSIRLKMAGADQASSVQLFGNNGLLLDVERRAEGGFALKSAPGAAQGEESEKRFVAPTEGSVAVRTPSRTIVPASLTVSNFGIERMRNGLAPAGIGDAAMRDAAAALASIAPAGIDINRATFRVTWGKTEDGTAKLLSAAVESPNGRARIYWFAPREMPEGFFDAEGNRVGGGGFGDPIPGSHISSGFGFRGGVIGKRRWGGFHNGVDIAGQFGTPIYAAADGIVNYQGWYYNYGRTVKLTHGESLETLYAHMSRFADGVGPGTTVRKGDLIGYVGSTGRSTGPHLHFSVIANGEFVDPTRYFSIGQDRLTGTELASFRRMQQQVDQAGRSRGGLFSNSGAAAPSPPATSPSRPFINMQPSNSPDPWADLNKL